MQLQTKYTPSWQCGTLMAVDSFSIIMRPTTLQKLFKNSLRNTTKISRCRHSNFPDLRLIMDLWDVLDKQVMKTRSHGGLTPTLQDLKDLLLLLLDWSFNVMANQCNT